ncbi:LutB/LldF family L-lactate oxidation iron-sulfur protein [Maribacter sp. TH_r10]|uniref:Iron-sulfur cluster-binding protein n=1 Tax=Maribacter luteus TaxID=2594478 RepID=A0A6I2MLY5_9FLAO|nr:MULTISPECIES: LutB/LldF family L-lactate oxidation iron-sulfur protein [Maribacter]MDV7140369.1 LutB/LldF family L-lactate oxidation iron-sulfur protein [Maribacter sp. TH_r10]MRX64748.1 iron-sulfur cluster-binding protein [Maribacter luteus]
MSHAKQAEIFNKNEAKVNWHDKALWYVREKRDNSAHNVKGWEHLRDSASGIKAHVLSNLDEYLIQFEQNALQNGIKVHWASDAEEHNTIIHEILKDHKAEKVVKSKSMLTEECHLNPYLEEKGIEVIDTDLGERIVQLAKEPPSHIVLPAIHKTKEEVDVLFQEHLGTKASQGDPEYLTNAARKHLRGKFLNADVAITGVNFAVADTGGFVVCTNEGNADMGAHLAKVHIACMGIEKIIPKEGHLGIFLRLLARSATGQPITTYSSHFNKPTEGKEIHIVIVDNGRTEQLSREDFRASLHCIRCGACMNTCPIYRRSGGHSYDATIPGPIGSILSPGKDLKKHSSLPFASTLCGSCSNVCPVKINIHEQLYKWRQIIVKEQPQPVVKKSILKMTGTVFSKPGLYSFIGKSARFALKYAPKSLIYSKLNAWGKARDLPEVKNENFDDWYKKRSKNNG